MAYYKNILIEDGLIRIIHNMQSVNDCLDELNNLQRIWDNLSLLGHLSSTGTNMDETRQSFHILSESLINQLTNESLKKTVLEITSKAQVAIDILIRNLFERTADIGFLATDDDICNILKKAKYSQMQDLEVDLTNLKSRFAEYLSKYTVYSDVVLLETDGEILLRHKNFKGILKTQHQLLKDSIQTSDNYIETFDHIDFLPDESSSLVYSFKVTDKDKKLLGVLCLCFKFENEMKRIFTNLISSEDWSVITLLNDKGIVIASSDIDHIPLGSQLKPILNQEFSIQRFAGKEYLTATRSSSGYQGYGGPNWYAHVMLPLQYAFNREATDILKDIPPNTLDTIMQNSRLFGERLSNIPKQADRIQRELNRSVWNGNIRQCRSENSKDSQFSKILLWEISSTGSKIQSLFQHSIANLLETVISSVLEDSHLQASLAIDIMDRNLYERANDCRWWALTSSFREILSHEIITDSEKEIINKILSYINSLYTVYYNLILFDASGQIIAVSNTSELALVGEIVGEEWHRRVLKLTDSQGYAVSEFSPTRFYKGNSTYIYGAAIRDPRGIKVIGGIGIVFDSTPQLSAMLRDALPKNSEDLLENSSFGVFVTRNGRVLSCSNDRFSINHNLTFPSCYNLSPGKSTSGIIMLDGRYYAFGAHASSGYREYKSSSDLYKNEVIALIAKELCFTNENNKKNLEVLIPTIHSDRNKGKEQVIEIATFKLCGEWFGIRANQVYEAVDSNFSPVPGEDSSSFIGYLMHDKFPIPIFDISKLICKNYNAAEPMEQKSQHVMIIEKDTNERFGILVDALGEIPEVNESRLNFLPSKLVGKALIAEAILAYDKPNENNMLLILSSERLIKIFKSDLDEKSLSKLISEIKA